MTTRFVPICVLTACVLIGSIQADDWPQWRGPNRTGVSRGNRPSQGSGPKPDRSCCGS